MIDNYDSFTYNIVQYFGELGEKLIVYRNDKITIDEISTMKPDKIIIFTNPVNQPTGWLNGTILNRHSVRAISHEKVRRSRDCVHSYNLRI